MSVEREWLGSHPYYLLILPESGEPFTIDLDKPGWVEENQVELEREGSTLSLTAKKTGWATLVVKVRDGMRYTSRVFGRSNVAHRLRCYGFVWGDPERSVWVLPTDQVCVGEDIDAYVKALLTGR